MPAFEPEAYSPPLREIKPHLDFYYGRDLDLAPDAFWAKIGKDWTEEIEKFIGTDNKDVQATATRLAPTNSADRLKKLYEFVQSLRNTSFEREKNAQEAKRDKTKDNKNADDVLKHGYGDHSELNQLFAALAQAAGFDAHCAWISGRDQYFFKKEMVDSHQLDAEVVLVKVDGHDQWFDPGTPFTPFGMLRWPRTGVSGLLMQKGKNDFIKTPEPASKDAVTHRVINLKQTDAGFKAEITITYNGYESLENRLEALNADDAHVRQTYEESMKAHLPAGSTVKVTRIDSAKGIEQPFAVTYEATLPDFTSAVGSRRLTPLAILEMSSPNPFQHETRKYPVYFSFPYQEIDEITFELPSGNDVEKMPDNRKVSTPLGSYSTTWSQQGNKLTLIRTLDVPQYYISPASYPILRQLFSQVAGGDRDTVVLRTATASGTHP